MFRQQVDATRRLGYCFAQQQLDISLCGLAVALQDRKGKCLGAIGITMQMRTSSRAEVIDKMLPLLMDSQQTLRAVL